MNRFSKQPVWTSFLLILVALSNTQAQQPTVLYDTYLSGFNLPLVREVVVNEAGSAFTIGSAYSDGQHIDLLVIGFDPVGAHLWTVEIANGDHNYASGITLDSSGNIWVTGWTDSPVFPLVNPLDNTLTGFRDVFLMQLSPTDGAILYSTYLGGDYTDEGRGITLNSTDEIYLAGLTKSTDFPTLNAYQDEPSAPLYVYTDAFVMKLSAGGDAILYSSYFGGYMNDRAISIALDDQENMIFAGETEAVDFPLENPIQSDPRDLFVSKLSADGSTLLFSSYLGGEDYDRLGSMVMDLEGFVYLTGSTRSVEFPTTPGAYQEDFVGEILACEVPFGQDYNCEDIFACKLGTDGSGLIWSTFLAGSTVDEGRDISYDSFGNTFVTGYTSSADFPPDGMDFGAEIVVCHLDPTGSTLVYTHSVDSGSANRGNGITVDLNNDIYYTGTVGVPADIYIAKLSGAGPPLPPGVEDLVISYDLNQVNLSWGAVPGATHYNIYSSNSPYVGFTLVGTTVTPEWNSTPGDPRAFYQVTWIAE